MKKIAITTLFIISAFLLVSCVSIHGSFRGLYSYYKHSYKEEPTLYRLLQPNENMDSIPFQHQVLIITDKNISKILTRHKKVLIYGWNPLCESKFCYSLQTVYEACKNKGIAFYPISDFYVNSVMEANLNADFPVLVPNTKYYKSNLVSKYLRRFYGKLSINPYANPYKGRLYYYKDGKLNKIFRDISLISKLN